MCAILLGFTTIGLGAKAFSPTGLPLTNRKNLTGGLAKGIGIGCVVLGVAFIIWGVISQLTPSLSSFSGLPQ